VRKENRQGKVLSEAWGRGILAIEGSQHCSVSFFESSPLYGGRHTYIYGAVITDIADRHRRVGCVGMVFDSEPRFREMLLDSLQIYFSEALKPGA
jgi:hypothetical protein